MHQCLSERKNTAFYAYSINYYINSSSNYYITGCTYLEVANTHSHNEEARGIYTRSSDHSCKSEKPVYIKTGVENYYLYTQSPAVWLISSVMCQSKAFAYVVDSAPFPELITSPWVEFDARGWTNITNNLTLGCSK